MQFLQTGSSNLIRGIVEGRLERFRDGGIALPAFVLEDDQLNGDGSGELASSSGSAWYSETQHRKIL